ncbi:hypothetical protein D043_0569A, partial [Vibrio parahaemolyticus EKP-021]
MYIGAAITKVSAAFTSSIKVSDKS